jgi:hypothetical protein
MDSHSNEKGRSQQRGGSGSSAAEPGRARGNRLRRRCAAAFAGGHRTKLGVMKFHSSRYRRMPRGRISLTVDALLANACRAGSRRSRRFLRCSPLQRGKSRRPRYTTSTTLGMLRTYERDVRRWRELGESPVEADTAIPEFAAAFAAAERGGKSNNSILDSVVSIRKCTGRESNPYALRRRNLNSACRRDPSISRGIVKDHGSDGHELRTIRTIADNCSASVAAQPPGPDRDVPSPSRPSRGDLPTMILGSDLDLARRFLDVGDLRQLVERVVLDGRLPRDDEPEQTV